MKKILEKGFLAIAFPLLFCSSPLAVMAQQNTVIVTDAKGTGIKDVVVTIFEGTAGKCGCIRSFCMMLSFASVPTDEKGHAEFRDKAKPLKPGISYMAFIGAKCESYQQQCTQYEDCRFTATSSKKIDTDRKGNFNAVTIIK